jgi:DNA-binding response OmpR family regulator
VTEAHQPDGLWISLERGVAGWGPRVLPLTGQEVALLAALVHARGRVLPRRELARRAGLGHASERRCDQLLVGLRAALGPDAVRNVRGRGWMLMTPAVTP